MAYDINELIVSNAETDRRISEGIEKKQKGRFHVKGKDGRKGYRKTKKPQIPFWLQYVYARRNSRR